MRTGDPVRCLVFATALVSGCAGVASRDIDAPTAALVFDASVEATELQSGSRLLVAFGQALRVEPVVAGQVRIGYRCTARPRVSPTAGHVRVKAGSRYAVSCADTGDLLVTDADTGRTVLVGQVLEGEQKEAADPARMP